jgi:hypothetical protein
VNDQRTLDFKRGWHAALIEAQHRMSQQTAAHAAGNNDYYIVWEMLQEVETDATTSVQRYENLCGQDRAKASLL